MSATKQLSQSRASNDGAFMFTRLLTYIPALLCVTLAACTSRTPLSSTASCIQKQTYCLDGCNNTHNAGSLGSALALALAKPKTEAARQQLANSTRDSERKATAERNQCRANCDTLADRCRQLM